MDAVAAIESEVPTDDGPRIYELARTCLDDADGNVERATIRLNDMLLSDQELRLSMLTDIVRLSVSRAIDQGNKSARRKVWNAPIDGEAAVRALANGISNSLYDFPLAGGVKLGDATKAQVTAQSQTYGTLIMDMSIKRRFMSAIAAKMNAGQVVRDALSEDQLKDLKREAMK